MSNEKLKILEMVQSGKISNEEALNLLNALENPKDLSKKNNTNVTNRFLRVRVNGSTSVKKVDVNIPLSLLQVASSFMHMIPKQAQDQMKEKGIDLTTIDFDELLDLIDQGLTDGKLVDVEIDDEKEGEIQVEVYVD
ncbi:MAG: SHOCT-like domain-containing protein [Eubacteriaceae bacterium]